MLNAGISNQKTESLFAWRSRNLSTESIAASRVNYFLKQVIAPRSRSTHHRAPPIAWQPHTDGKRQSLTQPNPSLWVCVCAGEPITRLNFRLCHVHTKNYSLAIIVPNFSGCIALHLVNSPPCTTECLHHTPLFVIEAVNEHLPTFVSS